MSSNKKTEFILEENDYYKMSQFEIEKYVVDTWNVNETISELSYLTHDYFRYYGKFPSKIGSLIIDGLTEQGAIDKEKHFVMDNYVGSGTSLVEAKMRGFDSIGVDINPLAVLASRVKTYNLDVEKLRSEWQNISSDIQACLFKMGISDEIQLFQKTPEDRLIQAINREIEDVNTENKDLGKWFPETTAASLAIIKTVLLQLEKTRYREFFVLAFLAIIRRVSTAYDGEVRPHVNKKKRQREVFPAYKKKVEEMICTMEEWNLKTDSLTYSDAFMCNNADSDNICSLIKATTMATKKKLGLVISHPPYLNCFDYIPVFKLKFMWSKGIDEVFGEYDYKSIKAMEIKSYPANSTASIERYFSHNQKVYTNIFENLSSGGYCCVVIGDCTLFGKLFEVHKTFISMLEKIGFKVEKVVYRSTMYGVGQYAYKFRADYNEDKNRKKDAVIFFKKP